MHTSYFLFVMVITMFCYAVIKGRPSKLRQSNPEFCPEKVSSGWGLTQHCTRKSQLVLVPFILLQRNYFLSFYQQSSPLSLNYGVASSTIYPGLSWEKSVLRSPLASG